MDASVARQQIKDAIIKIQQYLIRWDGKVITTGLWDVATNTAYKKARNIESDRLIVKGMIMSLQSLINQLLNDHVIVVDGVYGKLTHAAYVELLKSIKPLSMTESFTNSWDRAFSSVTTLLTKRVVPEEHNFEKGIEVPSGRRYLSEAEIRPFISHALAQLPHSVAEVNVEVVLKFLSIEAAYKVVDGIKMFDTRGISPNRAYFGLFQIGRDAWSDARRVYPKLNLPPFNEGKFDAKWNTLACVAYMMFNARQMITNTVYNKIKYGAVPVNGDTLYLAHNQGVAGSKRAIREGRFRNDQSDKAVQVLRDVRAQGVRA